MIRHHISKTDITEGLENKDLGGTLDRSFDVMKVNKSNLKTERALKNKKALAAASQST